MQQQLKHSVAFALSCAIVFVLTEFFGSRYIGPLTLRNYAVLFCLVLPIILGGGWEKGAFKSFRILIVYYVFVMFLGFVNGLYIDNIGRELVLGRFVPMIAVFSLITSTIKQHGAMVSFVYLLLFILGIDAVATILQGTGNNLGWIIKSYFSEVDLAEFAIDEDSSIGGSFASGISGTVVSNGFLLASLGLLFWVPYEENKTKGSFVVSFVLWALFLVALFYNQQRIAFYVYLFFSVLISAILSRSKLKFIVIVLCLFFIASVFFEKIIPSRDDLGRLSQVTNEDVSERHIRHGFFYHDFLPGHLFTGDRHQFVEEFGQTPHNMIIETLLLGGLGGLVIYLLFIVSLIYRELKIIIRRNKKAVLFSFPIIVILLISWEHSSGFHTGMTLGAYCLALFELTLAESSIKDV